MSVYGRRLAPDLGTGTAGEVDHVAGDSIRIDAQPESILSSAATLRVAPLAAQRPESCTS